MSVLTVRNSGAEEHSVDIGPLWLTTSKIAIKANHLQTAYSAILQATQLRADFTFMQSAKLYYANGHLHRALQELEQGLKLLGALEPGAASKLTYDAAMLKKLAKVSTSPPMLCWSLLRHSHFVGYLAQRSLDAGNWTI